MNTESTSQLAVKIQTAGGELTMTPMSLLNFWLPGARQDPNNPQLYIGRQPGATKDCYVQVEALAGMLMDAKEKHLNPVTQLYLVPSNSPGKRASHKVAYKVGLERSRKILGFLGINSGLIVTRLIDPLVRLKKKKEIKQLCQELNLSVEETTALIAAVPETETLDRSGSMPQEGDKIVGSWAEAYVVGLTAPLRKEIDSDQFWQDNNQWKEKGPWMLVKVAEDHLCVHGLASLFADEQPSHGSGSGILLEAQREPESPETPTETAPSSSAPSVVVTPEVEPQPYQFQPDTMYVGAIRDLLPRVGVKAGGVSIDTEHGVLVTFFYQRPEELKRYDLSKDEDKKSLIGQPCSLSFTEKRDAKTDALYRYVATFQLAPQDGFSTEAPSQEEAV